MLRKLRYDIIHRLEDPNFELNSEVEQHKIMVNLLEDGIKELKKCCPHSPYKTHKVSVIEKEYDEDRWYVGEIIIEKDQCNFCGKIVWI